jgi:2,3-bisphosphoglycerate-dependent phosphoglycerate mutase
MNLLWIRHAEPERIAPGSGVPADPGLTPLGHAQAQRLADWLAPEAIDVVLSSPKRRAQETAAPLAAKLGLEVEIVEGIVEYDVQSDHYIPMEELRRTDQERLRDMMEGRWETFGGESTEVFTARIKKTTDQIIEAHPGKTVVAVCHGGVVNVALALVLGLQQPLWFDPHYTSLSRMVASRTGVRSVSSLNECAHLVGRRDGA